MKAVQRASHEAGEKEAPTQAESLAIIVTCLEYLEAEAVRVQCPDSAAHIGQAIKSILSGQKPLPNQ